MDNVCRVQGCQTMGKNYDFVAQALDAGLRKGLNTRNLGEIDPAARFWEPLARRNVARRRLPVLWGRWRKRCLVFPLL